MSSDYTYDEQGQFFPYFILTLTGLVTLPVSWSLLKPSKDPENTAPRIHSDFTPEHADLIEGQRRKQKRRERKLKRMIFTAGGWLVMAYMVYLIWVTARTVPKIWDPWEVLGISRSADEKTIKSHYRRLSLTQHPDKVKIDPTKNETLEQANEHWVEITKAFKTLTDEEARNNYIQYGHPDGKQSFSIGIALPKFLVEAGNGKYVLALYGIVLGVVLPYLVGKWWYGQQRVTKEKVLVASAGNMFKEYEDGATEGGVIGVLSSGEEYKEILSGNKSDNGLAKLEQLLLLDAEDNSSPAGLGAKDRKKLLNLDEGVRRKALGLLWAYLGRVELNDPALNDEKFEVGPTALALNEAYTNIALAYGNTQQLLSSFRTSQHLIQAIPPGGSPLLQLPHFTPAVVRAIEGESARTHMTVQSFMALPSSQRESLAVGPHLLTPTQYATAMATAAQLPQLRVEKAFFKVTGERYITPSSLVQLVLKARIIPPGTPTSDIPAVDPKDLEDPDPKEGDLDALHGRGKNDLSAKEAQPPLAHAPYFARDHSPRWHVFLADAKQGKIAVPPFTFSTFDNGPLFDADGKPTFRMQTLRMQFGAPPQPGRYTFVMWVVSDSYVGMDVKMDVVLVVEDAEKAEGWESEEDISEPEDDSIAGQMNALKSGGAGAKRKGKAKKEDEEDESSSDTEGDEDDDTSETDTSTDTDTDTDEE